MDSSANLPRKEKGLSAGSVANGLFQTTLPLDFGSSPTSSKKGSSLVRRKPKKKVPRFPCENPYELLFLCKHCGNIVYRTVPCHARFAVDCPYCAEKWRKKVIANFVDRVNRMIFPVFVTLTLKKGGKHGICSLNSLRRRCKEYLRRKKKNTKRCDTCVKRREKNFSEKVCRKCSNTYDIRACVCCLDPPNHVHAIWDCDYIPQIELSETWKLVTGDSFIVDIRKVERHRRKKSVNKLADYISKLCYYVSKISESGSAVDLSGVHVVNSWGDSAYYEKMEMRCKKCGGALMFLKYDGSVADWENDPVDFVVSNKGPPLKYLQLLSFITDNS